MASSSSVEPQLQESGGGPRSHDGLSPPKPISFAAAIRQQQSTPKPTDAPAPNPAKQEPLRLKRWPKSKDPKVLLSYLDAELRNGVHVSLFKEISGPNTKTEKRLIIMRGLPGSGKSILSTLLAGVTDSGVILSADDYFVDRRGIYRYNPNDIGKAHEVCKTNCKAAMVASQNPIIIDNTNTQTWEMLPYVELALDFQYRIYVIEPTTAWKNNVRTLAEKNSHGVPFDKIKAMHGRYDKGVTAQQLVKMVRSKPGQKSTDLNHALGKLSLR